MGNRAWIAPRKHPNDRCFPLSTKHSFFCQRDEDGNISGTSSGAEFSLSSLQTNVRSEQLRNFERNRVLPFITVREHPVGTCRELRGEQSSRFHHCKRTSSENVSGTENQIKNSDDFSFFFTSGD